MVIRSQAFFVQRGNLSNRLVRRQAAAIGAAIAQGGQQAREIIADNLKKRGWSLGWVSALDLEGRTIWIVDAHGYGKRFIVRADELLTAFVELQGAIHEFAVDLMS
jgi:hypothetical protein